MRILYAHGWSGMGDRIALLIPAIQLAKESNRDLIYIWPRNEICGAAFQNLFVCRDESVQVIDHIPPNTPRPVIQHTSDINAARKAIQDHNDDEAVTIHSWGYWYSKPLFGSLVDFSDQVKAAAEKFTRSMSVAVPDSIGVHCRLDYVNPGCKPAPLSSWFDLIDKFNGDRHMILASDSRAARDAFFKRYPARVYEYPCRGFMDAVGCFDGCVTLVLLRMCHDQVLSAYSKYSQLCLLRDDVPSHRCEPTAFAVSPAQPIIK